MIWTFFLYLAILIGIGIVANRFTKGLDSFVLGDRQSGVWVTALSYEATAYSGWLMLGFPGKAFAKGLCAIWVGISCVIGDALNWILLSRRLRQETEQLRALTIPEYLDRKFSKPGSKSIRVAATLSILIFMFIYLWSQFVAAGNAISTVMGDLSYTQATMISALVILIYTFQGGYRAVIWTDAFQGVMMVIALVLLPAACLWQIGGWSQLQEMLHSAAAEVAQYPDALGHTWKTGEWFGGLTGLALFSFLLEDAGVGAGYLGQPHICVRFMGAKSADDLRPAFWISVVFATFVCTGAVGVGLVAHHWFQIVPSGVDPATVATGAREGLTVTNAERVLPLLAMKVLPTWLAGLVVSAIMAAIMSSASAYLLTASSSLVQDLYHQQFRPKASEGELLWASRLVTVGLGVGALLLALRTNAGDPNSSVYSLVLYGWGGLAASFSAPVTLAVFYRGMTRAGCLAGIVVGTAGVLAWRNIPVLVEHFNEVIPCMLLSAITVVGVSLCTRKTDGTNPVQEVQLNEGN